MLFRFFFLCLQVLFGNVNAKLLQNVEAKVYSKACITNSATPSICCSNKDESHSEAEVVFVKAGVASE